MRKNQIKSKLDPEFYHIVKNQAIEREFLERLKDGNKERDIKPRNDNNFNLSNA